MKPQAIRSAFLDALTSVAPEIEPGEVGDQEDLRAAFDLDSMDMLNLAIALHESLKVDIPESDIPALGTVAGAVSYLERAIGT